MKPFPVLHNTPEHCLKTAFSCHETAPENAYYLAQIDGQWSLCHSQDKQPFTIDFSSTYYRHRGGTEYLPKAFKGMAGGTIFDATAGWARDSWLLAYRGFQMTLCERHPALFIMLKQGIAQAQTLPLTAEVAARMNIVFGEAANLLRARASEFDAVYLDPMYPQREKSAKVKKDMQILHALLADHVNNGDDLLLAAQEGGAKRIIVKRPKGAPY